MEPGGREMLSRKPKADPRLCWLITSAAVKESAEEIIRSVERAAVAALAHCKNVNSTFFLVTKIMSDERLQTKLDCLHLAIETRIKVKFFMLVTYSTKLFVSTHFLHLWLFMVFSC